MTSNTGPPCRHQPPKPRLLHFRQAPGIPSKNGKKGSTTMHVYRKIAAACTVFGMLVSDGPTHAASPAVYAYVVLGYSPGSKNVATPMARVIVAAPAQSCPTLTPVGTVPGTQVLTMTPRINPNPANFPVTVCEALYPATGQH